MPERKITLASAQLTIHEESAGRPASAAAPSAESFSREKGGPADDYLTSRRTRRLNFSRDDAASRNIRPLAAAGASTPRQVQRSFGGRRGAQLRFSCAHCLPVFTARPHCPRGVFPPGKTPAAPPLRRGSRVIAPRSRRCSPKFRSGAEFAAETSRELDAFPFSREVAMWSVINL